MATDNSIKTFDKGSAAELLCPRCGASNLHHERVKVFARNEDDVRTVITEVRGSETLVSTQASEGAGNPSSRRDGLIVAFTCEQCSRGQEDELVLSIAQHKGATEIRWHYEPRPAGNA